MQNEHQLNITSWCTNKNTLYCIQFKENLHTVHFYVNVIYAHITRMNEVNTLLRMCFDCLSYDECVLADPAGDIQLLLILHMKNIYRL